VTHARLRAIGRAMLRNTARVFDTAFTQAVFVA
jgi:hypothetical protein